MLILGISRILFHLRTKDKLVFRYRQHTLVKIPIHLFVHTGKMISSFTDNSLAIAQQIKETMSFTYQLLTSLIQHTVQGIVSHCHFVIGIAPLHNLIQITKSLNRSITAQLATSLSGNKVHLGQTKYIPAVQSSGPSLSVCTTTIPFSPHIYSPPATARAHLRDQPAFAPHISE